MRFAVSLPRFIPFVGFHHVLMMLQTFSIILTSIVLAGCSSYSSMTNVYILGLSYTNSTTSNLIPDEKSLPRIMSEFKGDSQLDVRTGYFGMCVHQRGVVWLCSSDASGLAIQVGQDNDPLNLIGAAEKFKGDVIFSGLLFMAIVLAFTSILLLATFPGWHQEIDRETGSEVDIKPFPSRPISYVALACSFVATVLLLISSLWQHIGSVGAAAMAEIAYQGNVHTDIGTQAVSMTWASFMATLIVTLGLHAMIWSLAILDRLTDED
ncbi:hypothetical protein P171DRAFT_467685 [Karstenula rhodostoma CBS 690.94]|uniref:Ca2+ regulator and membrane fusion protein Fig1-domain-containing protein n=1 Tax=Karstenula rhodostoma CBS 690.94 TaxID=1392251 RepID=A0A9P4P5R9_9PLEO|nr:hypothetical protein P171DRAFT_467685 [Karstenula rhodostoma CBS 690.94]